MNRRLLWSMRRRDILLGTMLFGTMQLGAMLFGPNALRAQVINPARGVDPRVIYGQLDRFGPWDDRNYNLTLEDLAVLAPDEALLTDAIPAFYRVLLRSRHPELRRSGPAQYPRSALPRFLIEFGGYLYEGSLYRGADRVDGRTRLVLEQGVDAAEAFFERLLGGEARVTSPNGAAESAVAISPVNPDIVIAGSNGPGSGQQMHRSIDGGETWSEGAALPLDGTCCDPTVGWSSDGTKAYTATLGSAVWIYRSSDGGQNWDDLLAETPGDPRREIGAASSDKEYLHVDTHPTSPNLDNIYLTWHEGNTMYFSRSTDFGDTWASKLNLGCCGIGSDITSDRSGNVYHLWPSFNSQQMIVQKSTNGGTSFLPNVVVAATQAAFAFSIPSIENRQAFVYVAADTDRTDGPYADSIYAAWTDSTAATTETAANNHARIQVAYSRDGGVSWTVVTPHETNDANTVDRWHPWLAVAADGAVHVVFYDTRRDATRTSVDFFHSVSTNGGQSFGAPERLTTVQSPNITNTFEFGDYNGLDVVVGRLLTVFTDNRPEGAQVGESVDVYAAGRGFESADLRITKDDGVTQVETGGNVTYILTAENLGPDAVMGATVADAFPTELSCSWTCVASAGASCTPGPTVGDISDSVGLPASGSVTYTASCQVSGAASGTLTNTATITSPVSDPVLGNNNGSDVDDVIGACTLPDDDLVLQNDTINTAGQVEQACNSITAGPAYSIVAPGEMTFRVRNRVLLRSGFSVGPGATFHSG